MDKNATEKLIEYIKQDDGLLYVDNKKSYIKAKCDNMAFIYESCRDNVSLLAESLELCAIYDCTKDILHFNDDRYALFSDFININTIRDDQITFIKSVCENCYKTILKNEFEISDESVEEALLKICNKDNSYSEYRGFIVPIITGEYTGNQNEYFDQVIYDYLISAHSIHLSSFIKNYDNLVAYYKNSEKVVQEATENLLKYSEISILANVKNTLFNIAIMNRIMDNPEKFPSVFKDKEIYNSLSNLNCSNVKIHFYKESDSLQILYSRNDLITHLLTRHKEIRLGTGLRKTAKNFLEKHNLSELNIYDIGKITTKGKCIYRDLTLVDKEKTQSKSKRNVFEKEQR